MNTWQNGQAHAMFPQGAAGHINPAMYNNLAAAGQGGNMFDVNQFNMLNGGVTSQGGTPQPAFGGPQNFNPASVVPAKRPHDGMSGSPQPNNNPASRSQTPGNPYGGFANQQQPGAQQFSNAPTPYQHLQQQPGSNNATPSPTVQNQQFRPPPQSQPQQQRMSNASPSPFPQQANFGAQMPGTPTPNPQQQQQAHLAQYNQQFGMNPAMAGMAGMSGQMQGQMQNQMLQQRQYQMKLLAQQQQLRASGMMQQRQAAGQPNQMNHFGAAQQAAGQMPNGQGMNTMQAQAQAQVHIKRQQFLQALQKQCQAQGRPFNPAPMIGDKAVDLFALWNIITSSGGSQQVERLGQWQLVANKMQFPQPQYPNAAEELKNLYQNYISHYERLYMQMRMSHKQDQARMHAQQMAGISNPQQASPTKMMQPPAAQQNQFQPFPQGQQSQQPPQGTPIQHNNSIPSLDGMSTPQQHNHQQQLMGPGAGLQAPRRNSSVKRSEPMTPQSAGPARGTASPSAVKPHRSSSVKQEPGAAVMKSDEPQSTNYVPQSRIITLDGGYDIPKLFGLGDAISRTIPNMPNVDEMGVIDTKTITLSLASGIHAEVRYALDALATISCDPRVPLNLQACEDLTDVIIDCAEEQIDLLSEEAIEVSDALDLPSYEDVMRGAKTEADTLQDVPKFGTSSYELDRAADKLIAITTILRNSSFYEFNHSLLTSLPLIKWLSNTIRLLATRNMLLRTYYNTQDFYKDMIIFLSNVTQSLELPSKDDALHILHFLLAFAPQPSPDYTASEGKIKFDSFAPLQHRYLPPAVDCLAKLLARQDPNRAFYRSIFSSPASPTGDSESPVNLLIRAFALAISVLPDRTKGAYSNTLQLRIVDARKAYLTQGMLAADILTTLAPNNDTALARAWIESEDGWARNLIHLAALLSVDRSQPPQNQMPSAKGRDMGYDYESFKLIVHRALTMTKRLAEKAGRGGFHNLRLAASMNGANNSNAVAPITNGVSHDNEPDHDSIDSLLSEPKWDCIPEGHTILGACLMPNTDRISLNLLYGLHDMAMHYS